MPLKRKLIKVGDSRAVILPADWLRYYEGKTGREIENVLLEVNNVITLTVEGTKPSESQKPE